MIAAWLATVTVLPALWAVFDRGTARRRLPALSLAWFASRIERRPRRVLAIAGVVTVLAAAPLAAYVRDPFEYDLGNLRNRASSHTTELGARVAAIFGETTVPLVILADRREQVPEIRAQLANAMATPDGKRLITAARTIDDFVPTEQIEKLAILAEIRRAIDEIDPADLDEADARALRELRPPAALQPITIGELPPAIRKLFTEVDGTVGRIVLVYDVDRLTSTAPPRPRG
jgi:hypothetical protein